MRTSHVNVASARAASADAHSLALIASSLVAATAIAFLAMVITAWPAAAGPVSAPVQVAGLATMPQAAEPCGDRLAAAEAEINRSLVAVERLQEADMAAQCPAIRGHLASLNRAVATADRCLAGPDRAHRVGFFRQSLAEWRSVIAHGCR